jgi:DMSO/TMAO reductase YedYZ heme-binding membrane subunit
VKLWWYVARAGGLVGWSLLAASVLWGLVLASKMFKKRARPAWTLDLHRFLGGASVFFTGVHIVGLVADSYAHFGPAEILVPLASRWHPVAVAWGVVAFYLIVAIEITSLAMKRLSNRTWKRVHRLGAGLFFFATLHGITAGTDTGGRVAMWTASGVLVLATFLWLSRVFTTKPLPVRTARTGRRPASERGSQHTAGAVGNALGSGEGFETASVTTG